MRPQAATVLRPARVEGCGLHGGQRVRVTLRPRQAAGIAFVRDDLAAHPPLLAGHRQLVDTRLAVTLGLGAPFCHVQVSTVEHLLAALWASGIDRVSVHLDAPELPILDGASASWLRLLAAAGRAPLPILQPQWRLTQRVRVVQGRATATARPAADLALTYVLDYHHRRLPRRPSRFAGGPLAFAQQLAPARTFAFAADLAALRRAGRARGGSLGTAVVLSEGGVHNPLGLRFADECVRHKMLDCLGDLMLLGAPLCAHVIVRAGGHRLHCALVEAMLRQPGALAWHA